MNKDKRLLTDEEMTYVSGGQSPEMQQEIEKQVTRALANFCGREFEEISGNTKLGDLGMDSLDVVDMVSNLEKTFRVCLSEDDMMKIRTVQDINKLILNQKMD